MKKKAKKTKKTPKFHLCVYVEDCGTKIKKFSTVKALNDFVLDFTAQYPDQREGDNWIDYVVTGVTGEIHVWEHSCLSVQE
jgi:hypothetical protein